MQTFLDRNKLDLTLLKNSRKFQWTRAASWLFLFSAQAQGQHFSSLPSLALELLSSGVRRCADKAVGYAGVS